MAIGYIKKKLVEGVETLVPETTAGPSAGTVRKLSFDCNIDYAVPITADETGEGYVGVSGNCKVTFNPKCNIGTVADPEYIGVLKADCFCGKGQSTNISDCVEISSVNNNVNYKVPFTCDCEVLNACSQNLLYNPSTGLLTTNCICSNNEIEAACEIRAGEFCSRTANKGITAATTSEGNTVNHNGDIIYKGCDGELATSGCCQFTYNPSTGTLCVNHVVAIDDVTKTICCAFTNAANERITACVSANSGYLHTLVDCSDGVLSLGRYCECVTPSSKCVSTDGSISCCVFGSGGFNTTCETNASFRKDICNTSNCHLTRVNVDNTGVNLISQTTSLTCSCLNISDSCLVLMNAQNTTAGWRCPSIRLETTSNYSAAAISNKLVNSTTGDDVYNAAISVTECKVIGHVGDCSDDIGKFLLDCDGVFKVSNSCTSNNYARVLTECDNTCILKNPGWPNNCLKFEETNELNLYSSSSDLWLNYRGGANSVKIGDGCGTYCLGNLYAGVLSASNNTSSPKFISSANNGGSWGGAIAPFRSDATLPTGDIWYPVIEQKVCNGGYMFQLGWYGCEPGSWFVRSSNYDNIWRFKSGDGAFLSNMLCTQTICFY